MDCPLESELELHLGDDAYIGLTRIEDHRVNICGLFRLREIAAKGKDLLLAYLDACRLDTLSRRLAHATLDARGREIVTALLGKRGLGRERDENGGEASHRGGEHLHGRLVLTGESASALRNQPPGVQAL